MTDPDPHLNTTEVRQGNARKENSRALIFGLIGIVVLFALAIWFFTASYDETQTTTDGGATIEDTDAVDAPVTEGEALENLPTPAPTDSAVDNAPAEPVAPAEVTPEAETPAGEDVTTPAEGVPGA